MTKNIKIIFGSVYFLCLIALLYTLFMFLEVDQLTNFSYLKEKSSLLIDFKNNNLILFSIGFILFSIIWVFLLGFASPLAVISGFLFGPILGTLLCVIGFSVGCTILYTLANFYFKDLIKQTIEERVKKFKSFFNKNEFFYFMIFRFAGGGGIPFAVQNLMPVIFNMKIKNYFYSTIIGLFPTVFIINSLGSGFEKMIDKNSNFSFFEVILYPEIYIPLIGFILVLIVAYFINKKLFKK